MQGLRVRGKTHVGRDADLSPRELIREAVPLRDLLGSVSRGDSRGAREAADPSGESSRDGST